MSKEAFIFDKDNRLIEVINTSYSGKYQIIIFNITILVGIMNMVVGQ